ncbi:MAG: hypothetical protein HC880_01420 [Bacteroidia bacterium]|nr:hypothetical protein [Bacteroidia bacterium]
MVINFSDGTFNAGESFKFSIDTDPTSIKGLNAPGPGESGSVGGLELSGSTVSVHFSTGAPYNAQLFTDGSLGGSKALVQGGLPDAPGISIAGLSSPAVTANTTHQVTVTGPANAVVRLLHVEGAQFGSLTFDPFEVNSAISVKNVCPNP